MTIYKNNDYTLAIKWNKSTIFIYWISRNLESDELFIEDVFTVITNSTSTILSKSYVLFSAAMQCN